MDNWHVVGILVGIMIIFLGVALFFSQDLNPDNNFPEDEGYLKLNNETMICDYYYICFLREDKWHKPSYNSGVNLIFANNLEFENETQIKQFFEKEEIYIILNTTEQGSPDNSQLILEVSPFSHYLGYYYKTIKKEDKKIEAKLFSQYNSSEPAIIILGPNLGAKEDSVDFDGRNIIVQGQSSEGLGLVLGKLLLIIVS